MTTALLIGILLAVLYGAAKMLMADAYERGRRDEVLRRADLQSKLKEQQINVIMAPTTVDDVIRNLDDHGF